MIAHMFVLSGQTAPSEPIEIMRVNLPTIGGREPPSIGHGCNIYIYLYNLLRIITYLRSVG